MTTSGGSDKTQPSKKTEVRSPPWWLPTWSWWLIILLPIVGMAMFTWLQFKHPFLNVGSGSDGAARYGVANAFQALTAYGALILIWLTQRRITAIEEQTKTAQAQYVAQVERDRKQVEQSERALKASQDTAAKTEQQAIRGLETERYGRAIEQLGHDKIGIRIGGLFGLEALATDAPERFAETVYENLVAYLIEYTKPDPELAQKIEAAGRNNEDEDEPLELVPVPVIPKVGTDVQTVLKILFRKRGLFDTHITALTDNNETLGDGERVPVVGVHLVDVDLSGAWLVGADFREATLTDTFFHNAAIINSNFRKATLTDASFHNAAIINSKFRKATLTDASFREATLTVTSFREAVLNGITFHEAKVKDSDFGTARITDAHFSGTIIINTHFAGARITNSRFAKADLAGVDFIEATIIGTRFTDASITSSYFGGVVFTHTSFNMATITDTSFGDFVDGGGNTWPDGFTPPTD